MALGDTALESNLHAPISESVSKGTRPSGLRPLAVDTDHTTTMNAVFDVENRKNWRKRISFPTCAEVYDTLGQLRTQSQVCFVGVFNPWLSGRHFRSLFGLTV